MITSFLNLPVLHHEYSVCIDDGGKSMSDDYDSGPILAIILSQIFN